MKTVFITGVSGYFGAKLVSLFESKDDIGTIVGVDVIPPGFFIEKAGIYTPRCQRWYVIPH
ncbi:MAG: hypothetical protein JRC86_13315 [Deltaproteobacteria bacterium]|nr:hypothetical protein [Deltaproteobacteria bacterium]